MSCCQQDAFLPACNLEAAWMHLLAAQRMTDIGRNICMQQAWQAMSPISMLSVINRPRCLHCHIWVPASS